MRCEGPILDAKMAALRAHDSQTAPLVTHAGEENYRQWWSTEAFVDASSILVGSAS